MAEKYYLEGLVVARRHNLGELSLKLCSNIAAVNCFLGNRSRAEAYMREIGTITTVNASLCRVNQLLVEALIERRFGDWRKSIQSNKLGIAEIERGAVSRKHLVTPYSEICEMFEEHAMLDSALYYLGTYEKVAREFRMSNMQVDAQRLYMRIYTRLGQGDKALYYQDRYTAMQDSILNSGLFLSRAGRFERERYEATNRRIGDMAFKITLQQLILLGVGVALVVSLAFAFVIMAQKRRLHRSYRRLYEMNRELMRKAESGANVFKDEPPVDSTPARGCEGLDSQLLESLSQRILKIMNGSDVWHSPDFSLTTLAALAGSNTRYVSLAINSRFGKNFRTFINEYRVSEAMRRISDTDRYGCLTIQAIGESVGFMSRSNFISAFKKQTGLTPSVYQKISHEDNANS